MNEWNEAAKHLQDASISAAIARCVAPLRAQIAFIEDRLLAVAAAMEAAYKEPEPHSQPLLVDPSDDEVLLCCIEALVKRFGMAWMDAYRRVECIKTKG